MTITHHVTMVVTIFATIATVEHLSRLIEDQTRNRISSYTAAISSCNSACPLTVFILPEVLMNAVCLAEKLNAKSLLVKVSENDFHRFVISCRETQEQL